MSVVAISAEPSGLHSGRNRFLVRPHPVHERLKHIVMEGDAVAAFLAAVADIDVQNLEYVPFMRFMLAERLAEQIGPDLPQTLRNLATDRQSGGFTLGVGGITSDPDDFVRFGTAVGHLLGPTNHDSMSGTFYARFQVKDTDASDSYLRQAYRLFTLHTDGTFVEEATDCRCPLISGQFLTG